MTYRAGLALAAAALTCSAAGQEPRLEGFGTASRFGGGPGSEVCTVTSLADSGPGTLRECALERNGPVTDPVPRTVEFAVGGDIVLTRDLFLRQPHLTIDGLSAPAPGITLIKTGDGMEGELSILTWPRESTCAHDVLIQGLRFVGVWRRESEAHSQNAALAAIDGEDLTGCLENVVVWRNTMTDGQDTVGGYWGSVTDSTFAYNFVVYNHHPQQISHWPGGEPGQARERISVHHNIYAYAHERIPNIRGDVWDLDLIQNVFHKWDAFDFPGGYATRLRCRGSGCPLRINMIGNHWTSGGVSLGNAIDFEDGASPAEVYMRGNVVPALETERGRAAREFPRPVAVTTYPAEEFVTRVFEHVGHPYPTAEEARVKEEVARQVLSEL